MIQTLAQIHDACLAELDKPKSPRLTVPEDVTLRARLLFIIAEVDDSVVAAKLFREAMIRV